MTINMEEDVMEKRFGDKLEQLESGFTPSVLAKVFSAFTGKKVQAIKKGSGFNAAGDDKSKSIRCSMKANDGFLFPLEKAFFFISNKPAMVEYDRVASVEFNRVEQSGTANASRSFDLTCALKDGGATQFVNLARSEYKKLYDYLVTRKIRIKNIAKAAGSSSYAEDGGDDDDDPYMNQISTSARRRRRWTTTTTATTRTRTRTSRRAPSPTSTRSTTRATRPTRTRWAGRRARAAAPTTTATTTTPRRPAAAAAPTTATTRRRSRSRSRGGGGKAGEAAAEGAEGRRGRRRTRTRRSAGSAFMFFSNVRETIKAENPEASATGKIAGQGGGDGRREQGAVPHEASEDKARYEREKASKGHRRLRRRRLRLRLERERAKAVI